MIWLYHGTGGSGKSLDMASDVMDKIVTSHKNVIANFPVNVDMLYHGVKNSKSDKQYFVDDKKRKHGEFYYFDNDNMTVRNLIKYAKKMHKPRIENQTLICIDECQRFFNPRDCQRKDRKLWVDFFTQHRKLGYNLILTTPSIKLIDKQIIDCIEYVVRHRKMNNAGWIGKLLPWPMFCATYRWNGVSGKEGIMQKQYFRFHRKFENLYDSFKFFDKSADDSKEERYNIVNRRKTVIPEHDIGIETESP
jgi:zona occludens toxin (predicted ATPase)